jgi:hypothetical protein
MKLDEDDIDLIAENTEYEKPQHKRLKKIAPAGEE